MKNQKFKNSAQYRDFSLDIIKNADPVEDAINIESRTVTFPFSSEEPVEREYYNPSTGEFVRANEVLDHTTGVDLSRLKVAGSLFVNHDKNDLVGVVEEAHVDAKRGFVTVRFGRSARATEVFNDVVDKIRKTVSFGYRTLEAELIASKDRESLPTMLIKRWQPFEVSLETVPADTSVGVGRNTDEDYENEFVVRSVESEETEERNVPQVTITKENKMSDTFETGIKAERKRLNGMDKIADSVRHLIPTIDALKEEFKNSERTLDDFNAAIVAKLDGIKMEAVESRKSEDLGLGKKEIREYSIMRLANALSTGNWKDAGLELEISRAQADLNGTEARGAYIPLSILSRADAQTTTTSATGVVPTNFYGDQYIDVLRANSVVAAMGATVLPGLVGAVDIPKGTNEATFGWLSEGGANYSTQYSASTVQLRPQDIGGALGYTRLMQKQTGNPAIEALMRNSLNAGIGVFLDKEVLVGTQAAASGLTTTAGAISATTGVSWQSVTRLEANVAIVNAERGALGYITSPTVRGYMKTGAKSTYQGGFLMEPDGTVNGKPCMVTSNASTNLFYGNWNDVLIPMWGGVDIVVDTATNVVNGGVVLRAFLATDIAFRHAGSFAVQTTIAGSA